MRIKGWSNLLLASGLVFILGCGGGGGGGSSPAQPTIVAPAGLTYTVSAPVYTVGTAITADSPTSTGGAVSSYSIAPALPAGLALDPATGIISGTPAAPMAATSFTVTASNAGGSITATLTITVTASLAAPSGLSYTVSTPVYTVGTAITADNPTSTGGAVSSYSVAPALPAGLALDPGTGILSGTPTAVTASTSYTVTALNAAGSTTATLTITVTASLAAPSGLSYTVSAPIYTVGAAITADNPTSTGGAVSSYSIAPALPAGLALDPGTGILSGTPTAVTAATSYTVTASNAAGSTTATLIITVTAALAAPSGLTYPVSTPDYTVGTAITADSPTSTGGAVSSYSIAPALPAGLAMDPGTGIISGTPTAPMVSTSFTVTATNAAGSTTATLTIMVSVALTAPSGLTYSTPTAVYTLGAAIAANSPSSGGGTVASYSVSPALPAGLSLDPGIGVISGTPTAVTAVASYTVTALNGAGSTTATLTITVNDMAPATLAYLQTPALYSLGVPITPNTPSSTGGLVTSYSVSPALPAGLSLNTTTGTITGSPLTLTTQSPYTVTGSNSGGSTTATLTLNLYAGAALALPLSVHPGDAWMTASVPSLTSLTYDWTVLGGTGGGPGSITAGQATKGIDFSAGSASGTFGLQADVQLPSTNHVIGSQTVTVQTGTWLVEDGGLFAPIAAATATVLANGRVLVAGGIGPDGYPVVGVDGGSTGFAAIYDPATGNWNATGSLNLARAYHTATLLQDGTVLVAGGLDASFTALTSSEIYDPATGIWTTSSAVMHDGRQRFTATLLPSGKVLAAGGGNSAETPSVLLSAEIYDPVAKTWTYTEASAIPTLMTVGHEAHTATLLPDGTVLVAGGEDTTSHAIATSEVFDPVAGTWTATSDLNEGRYLYTATLLGNGMVLAAGGEGSAGGETAIAELYDYSTKTWTLTTSMNKAREFQTANLLGDGTVLLAYGEGALGDISSAEIYDPSAVPPTWTTVASLLNPRFNHASALLPDGTVLLLGGLSTTAQTVGGTVVDSGTNPPPYGTLASSEIYTPGTPGTGTWTGTVKTARQNHTATLLLDGTVLVAGGKDSSGNALNSAQLYNPTTRTWTSAGTMKTGRFYHTATRFTNGTVLLSGGQGTGSTTLSASEIYTPSGTPGTAGTWASTTGSMGTARLLHTATLLSDGTVLVAGGGVAGGTSGLTSSEIFTPGTGLWTATTGSLATARQNHTATKLGDGTVLVAGGLNGTGVIAGSEIYSAGSWTTPSTSMTTPRQGQTATLLLDGTVLVAGGADAATPAGAIATSELYVPGTGWSAVPFSERTARYFHTAIPLPVSAALPNGGVLVTGGYGASGWLSNSEIYATSLGTWSYNSGSVDGGAGNLEAERFAHTATLLNDGSVMVCFGNGGDVVTEIYVPAP